MKRLLALLALCFAVVGCPAPVRHVEPASLAPSVAFDEGARAAGLDFLQRTGAKESVNIVQTSAGGAGFLDYDGDGRLDIYLVQGEHRKDPGGGNRLYRNRGAGAFEDVTDKAGVRGHGYGIACTVGDFDADGRSDLYISNYGVNELFRNRGDGTFEEIAARVGADVKGFSVGAVFADLDRDGWPDLYVARYVDINPRSPLICHLNAVPTSCGPALYASQPSVFLRNEDGREFTDQTASFGIPNDGRAMAVNVADLNEDRRLDLFIANDTTKNALYVTTPGGRFSEEALAAGVGYGEAGAAEANMGADVGDYNGDGRLDVFVGVMQDRMSLLFRNEGEGLFQFVTRDAGLANSTAGVVTFGCGFLDYDNDGHLDLFQANGHVHNRITDIDARLSYPQRRQLFQNDGMGAFKEIVDASPALSQTAVGRGAAFGDLDNDGDVDILVNNLDAPPALLVNRAERLSRHWLRVKLEGRAPNRLPEGALLELTVGAKKLTRLAHSTYSYASANDFRVHFGLGDATTARPLRIQWPDGSKDEVAVSGVDREITVRQGVGLVETIPGATRN